MPTETQAIEARNAIIDTFDVPENWNLNRTVDFPESAVDETDQWLVAEYYHDTEDKIASVWLLRGDGVVQPFYDGWDWEMKWGEVYEITDLSKLAKYMED